MHTGDKIEIIITDKKEAIIRPISKKVDDIFCKLHRPGRTAVSLEMMDDAVRNRQIRSFRPFNSSFRQESRRPACAIVNVNTRKNSKTNLKTVHRNKLKSVMGKQMSIPVPVILMKKKNKW